MAIDNDLPSVKQPSVFFVSSSSSTTSSSLSPFLRQRRLIQVATSNSATFIPFPANVRQSFAFVPVCQPRTSHSATRLLSPTIDTQSLSNRSAANDPTSSISSNDHKRAHSERRINPILNNPLLNHRKEPKYPPTKSSNESTYVTRSSSSSKPLKSSTTETTNDIQLSTIRASTVPHIVHQPENNLNLSDRLTISIDNKIREQQMQYVNENKFDYITRWLNTVRTATYSNENFQSESKRTKRRVITS